MKDVALKMLERAKELLASGEVARVIGWKKGDFCHDPSPACFESEEELDGFANAIPETCKTVYLGHDVLPSETQEKIFKKNGITINVIPDYYYRDLEA